MLHLNQEVTVTKKLRTSSDIIIITRGREDQKVVEKVHAKSRRCILIVTEKARRHLTMRWDAAAMNNQSNDG